MPSLNRQISDLRRPNFEAKYFVPYGPLSELLTEDVVREAILGSKIEDFNKIDTIKRVVGGARRIFAILVVMEELELIYNFIEHDQFQNAELDHKLPLLKPYLEVVFGKEKIDEEKKKLHEDKKKTDDQKKEEKKGLEMQMERIEDLASKFEETQWEFAVPSFPRNSSHRLLHKFTRLPFTEERPVGEGGFGVVYKITLPMTLSGSDSGHVSDCRWDSPSSSLS
jgi:hypothetical protein